MLYVLYSDIYSVCTLMVDGLEVCTGVVRKEVVRKEIVDKPLVTISPCVQF